MKDSLKTLLKALLIAVSTVLVSPIFVGYLFQRLVLGADRATYNATQLLALFPGLTGQYLRKALLPLVVARCHPSVTVEFGAIFSKAGVELEQDVYIGPYSCIGWARIGRDTLIASNVQVLSGPAAHGIADLETPIRLQPGKPQQVSIGENCWLGAGVIVMADIGRDTVVAAGAVVTKPLPDGVIAAGVPARAIRSRNPDCEVDPPPRSELGQTQDSQTTDSQTPDSQTSQVQPRQSVSGDDPGQFEVATRRHD